MADPIQLMAEVMQYGVSDERYRELFPAFSQFLHDAECTTVERIAMVSAQISHESGGLKWLEEIADGSAYEGRTDLGNTEPGDGKRFKGRGAIMVTGRENYSQLSRWSFDRGLVPTPTFFVDNPEELASDRYCFTGATWFWTTH